MKISIERNGKKEEIELQETIDISDVKVKTVKKEIDRRSDSCLLSISNHFLIYPFIHIKWFKR